MMRRTVFVVAVVVVASAILGPLAWARWNARGSVVRRTLFAELQPVELSNCELQRFGEPNDGGYLVCANLLGEVKSAYSYGISGYDGWGCDVATKLSVPVHEYDCFDTRQPACPGGKLTFHSECVGGAASTQDGRVFRTIEQQVTTNSDVGKRLLVKIDVEGAEWDSFAAVPDDLLDHVDQLVVEFHHAEGEWNQRSVDVVRKLKRVFYVAHLHYNNNSCDSGPGAAPFPAWAYEVLFVNKRIATAAVQPSPAPTVWPWTSDSAVSPPRPHPLDTPNKPTIPDCQTRPGSS
jgi:hypothetical protein